MPIACYGLFSWLFPSRANPFRSVLHDRDSIHSTVQNTKHEEIIFDKRGLPPIDNTCYRADLPEDPRTQTVLIVLESYCPGIYDTESEIYCTHPVRAFGSRCMKANLPVEDKRIHALQMPEAKKSKSTPKGLYKAAYTSFMRKIGPHMIEKGWSNYAWSTFNTTKFWKKAAKSDILIMSILNFRSVVKVLPNKRYILVQTNDCATVSFALGCDLDDPRVLAVLQHTALNPIEENNKRTLLTRRHFERLEPSLSDDNYHFRIPSLSQSAMAKIHVAVPQVYRWRFPLDCGGTRSFAHMVPAFQEPVSEWLKPFHMRKYDIAFLGTITDHGERIISGVNKHRRSALKAISDLKRKYPHLNVVLPQQSEATTQIPYNQFLAILRDTRFFVSPYGFGEFSGKDYESMLAGAILVKPEAQAIRSYPNIYNDTMLISCSLDFKDLEQKLMPYLKKCNSEADRPSCIDRQERMEQMSQFNLLKLRSSMDLDKLADDWDHLLYSLASRRINMRCGQCIRPQKWMYDREGALLSREVLIGKAKILNKTIPENFGELLHHSLSTEEVLQRFKAAQSNEDESEGEHEDHDMAEGDR